jgi:hypothetical protein
MKFKSNIRLFGSRSHQPEQSMILENFQMEDHVLVYRYHMNRELGPNLVDHCDPYHRKMEAGGLRGGRE